jgi:hypothetical protein
MNALQIALAIYGGYKGYKSAKKSGSSGLGRIFGTALGAYGGYQLGSGITALGGKYLPTALTQNVSLPTSLAETFQNIPGFSKPSVPDVTKGIGAYKPPVPGTFIEGPDGGFAVKDLPVGGGGGGGTSGGGITEYIKKTFTDPKTGGLDLGKAALVGVPTALYASGAFETEPYERSMFTYNVNYPDLYRSRKFYTQDPRTGEVKEVEQQAYIPEERADVQEGSKFGPYKRETITLQQGGLASLSHFRDGGINYLPSKTVHDEDDEDNYMRVNGYVEDGAGNGDKEEDTMLAQLADGEFVTRTDGVLGAGILAGADPKNAKDMRKKGAEFFYEQQKRFKRIYDLLDASRKATAN